MRRRLRIACLCLSLGTLVNVLVAWCCGLQRVPVTWYATETRTSAAEWPGPVPPDWPPSPRGDEFPSAWNPRAIRARLGPGLTLHSTWCGYFNRSFEYQIISSGLPCRSMRVDVLERCTASSEPKITHATPTLFPGGTIGGRSPPTQDKFPAFQMPLQPIWPGFVANSIIYALVASLLVFGPPHLRRTLRLRRGLCPTCAYPTGPTPICPECGHSTPSHAAVPS